MQVDASEKGLLFKFEIFQLDQSRCEGLKARVNRVTRLSNDRMYLSHAINIVCLYVG